ncbi:uncharacterized protein VTP21DRAFT_9225 [Calcarisporiella thermophila]|uniref:uncharacterized protein n=1 Tax=Calcarisporiella thermophila TaxID=911321 RepID=UPI003742DE76
MSEFDNACINKGMSKPVLIQVVWALLLSQYFKENQSTFAFVSDDEIEGSYMTYSTRIIRPNVDMNQKITTMMKELQTFHQISAPFANIGFQGIKRCLGVTDDAVLFRTLIEFRSLDSIWPDYSAAELENVQMLIIHEGNSIKIKFDNSHRSIKDVKNMFSHFDYLLKQILLDDPYNPSLISEFRVQEPYQWALFQEFCKGEFRPIPFECLHHGFEAMAQLQPEAIAVEKGNKTISYKDLDERANMLAHALRRRGVTPGVCVGLVISRSIEMVIGILAILKAGGAYVPIDAAFPCERIASILDDVASPVLLTTTIDQKAVPLEYYEEVMLIDGQDCSSGDTLKPEELARGDDLAYIIFTSGTTGKPKGVMLAHKGVASNIMMHPITSLLGPGTRVGQFSAIAFDSSVADIFSTLSKGATLVLQGADFFATVASVDVVTLTPTGLQHLHPNDYRNIKVINAIGEACPNSLVDRWGDKVKFYTDYGPTEASIYCTCSEPLRPGMTATMGKILPNMRAYILDNNRRPLPIGAKGQLYIGGIGVALGYLNQPELTSEKFVEDPFGLPGSRMYASGDFARWLPTGHLEFCGRKDDQIKLSGYRIELEEIARAINQYSSVELAAVLVNENRLIGYVTPSSVEVESLRSWLFSIFPDYMVPTAIVPLESFPMTANGKIDKAVLKQTPLQQSRKERLAPVTDKEKLIVKLMASVLNVDEGSIDLNASFFALGGDSISTISLVSAFRRNGLHINVAQIFKAPTPVRLAAAAQERQDKPVQSSDTVVGNLPLTPIQRWFLDSNRANLNHYNQGWVLTPREFIDFKNFKQAIVLLVAHHDMLRARYSKYDGGEWEQSIVDVNSCRANVRLLTCKDEQDFQNNIKAMASSLNIEEGIMHCAALINLGDEQRIYFTIHHLAVDLVAWRILLEDLELLLKGGKLEEKTTSFRDWAISLKQQALLFDPSPWKRYINTTEMDMLIKGDSVEATCTGNQLLINKINFKASRLLDEANKAYRTSTQDLILVALLQSFHMITGESNLSLFLEGHGREPWKSELDVSRTVGWFTTVYPVALSIADKEPLSILIEKVKGTLRAVPDNGLSYGAIKYLAPSTEATDPIKRHKMTPITFNYFGHFHNFEKTAAFFRPDERYIGDDSADDEIFTEIEMNCYFDVNGCLQLNIEFNSSLFQFEILSSWGSKWAETMERIIDHCCDSNIPGGFIASDFTLLSDPALVSEFEKEHLPALRLKPRDVEDIYPTTPLQASFISALARDPQAYVVQSVYEIEGDFDISLLKAAWTHVASANAILRTAFVSTHEGIFQVVLKSPPDVFEETLEWSEGEVEELQAGYLMTDRRRGFRLDNITFARITVVHIKDTNRYRLFWTLHHSIIDAWSESILISDILKAYSNGCVDSRPSFKEHVETVLSINLDEAKEYWKSVFAGANVPDKLDILDSITNSEQSGPITKSYSLDVPVDAIMRYCKLSGVTMSNFLQAIWAIVLRHYTRCDDVIFGCVVMGRDERVYDVTRIIGAFINTIPTRIMMKDSMTIAELLKAVQDYNVASLPYNHVPLTDIKRWTDLPWTREMFTSLFSYQNISSQLDTVKNVPSGLKMTEIEQFEATEYPIALTISSTEHSLFADALINTALIGHGAVDRMISKFNEVLLILLNASPERLPTLRELDSLSSEDSSFIAEISHGKQAPLLYPCLHHGFEHNAAIQANTLAVEEPQGRSITYGELDARANGLAHILRDQGVAPGHSVGLVIKRSIEMIVGILAILKAGGAYVPIDAALPKNRIDYMLKDSSCTVIVATQADFLSVHMHENYGVVIIDEFMQSFPERRSKPVELSSSSDNAYVVYTSGTTGKPKGVSISHGGAMNCIQELLQKNGSGPGVYQSQFMGIGFDGAVAEIFTCFTHGGTLVLRSDSDLFESLRNVEALFITPTGLQHLKLEHVPKLRVMTVGAEAVPQSLVDVWTQHVELFNVYGPTETSIISSMQKLNANERIGVGRPFNNASYYVLDQALKMVPLGVAGQLYIAGAGVSKGYINEQKLTSVSFIDNPFVPGTLMYRTGDMARWNMQGNLEIIGRVDDQVKVKGYRVELSEVATAINSLKGVEAAVAIVKDNTLYGFVTPFIKNVDAIHDSLFDLLPGYMVPAKIVALDKFPQTCNGKVDKSKLMDMLLQPAMDKQLPVTDKQKLVIDLMASVLDIDVSQINLNTSFFALGGDSISAIALVSAFRRHGLIISVAQIFKAPTPARMVAVAQERRDKLTYSLDSDGRDLQLTPIQCWLLGTMRHDPNHFNRGWVLTPRVYIDSDKFIQSIASLVAHHDMLRARYRKNDSGEWKQTIVENSLCKSNIRILTCKDEQELQDNIKAIATSLDIEKGIMYCATLLNVGNAQRIYFTAHPLVVDNVSWENILRDLEQLLKGGKLRERTSSFQEWVISQEHQTSIFDSTLWEKYFNTASMNVLFMENGIEIASSNNQQIVNKLSATVSSLLDAANEAYSTDIQDLILVALLLSLHEITGATDLSFMIIANSREFIQNHLDLSRTVGCFTNIYPVTLSTSPAASLSTVIKGVKSTLRKIPKERFSHGAIKYLAPSFEATKSIKDHSISPIAFSYHRRFQFFEKSDSFFTPDIKVDACEIPEDEIFNGIKIRCSFDASGCLQLSFVFNASLFHTDILSSWGSKWTETMERIVEHCSNPNTPGGFIDLDFSLLSDHALISEIETKHLPALKLLPRDIEDIYPATPLQTSFISDLIRDASSNVVQLAYKVEGIFNENRLRYAWYKVAMANTILRTAFVSTQAGVFQLLLKTPPKVFENSLTWYPEEADELQKEFLAADRHRGFNLEDISFARITIVHIEGTNCYRLFWIMHHSIIDGWSISLLLDDMLKAYRNVEVEARPPFKNHVEAILSADVENAKEYWRSVFEGATLPEPLKLTDGNTDPETAEPITRAYDLGITLNELHAYCKDIGVTPSNFLRSLWAVILRHYTRCEDVTFGCVTIGRDESVEGITRMIGALINTIPIRVVLKDSMTFNELLQAVQDFHVISHPHSHVALSDIRRWTGLPWTQKMFPTIFSFLNFGLPQSFIGGIEVGFRMTEIEDLEENNVRSTQNQHKQYSGIDYPLIITIDAAGDNIKAILTFNPSMVGIKVLNRMMAKYQDIIRMTLCHSTETPQLLVDLDRLNNNEESDLQKFSVGENYTVPFECLHHGFEEMAQHYPEAIAVEDDDRAISYLNLDKRANIIARTLRQQGVIPGVTVGLVISRSIEMIIGILGILKAGGVYVPIDAAFPCKRIASILEHASCSVCLTTTKDKNAIPPEYSHRIIFIDGQNWLSEDASKPVELTKGEDLAYIIFTSGTTGRSKGVMIRHNGVISNIMVHPITSLLGPGTRVGQFTAIAFDSAVADIFSTLSTGATLVLQGSDFFTTLANVDVATLTPTGLQHLDPNDYRNIKIVNAIGETCPSSLVDRWGDRVKFFSDYGPTEISIYCSCSDPLRPGTPVTMGKVLPNMRVYVLDNYLKPVPIGVKGQIYVGGIGVALGYLNLPELTSEKFLEDPYGPSGSRMYATDDYARWLPTGELEFCGRKDDHVKLRGYRVELQEIMIAMNQYPSVENSVAITKDNGIFGFVTPIHTDTNTLREFLFDILPEYMVPSTIIALEQFPTTANGKIDKSKLCEIVAQRTDTPRHPITENHKLNEVNKLLLRHPHICDIVSTVYHNVHQEETIVAYFVPETNACIDGLFFSTKCEHGKETEFLLESGCEDSVHLFTTVFKKYLKSNLPNHPIPSVFIPLKKIPLTPQGKIDQDALPLPDTLSPISVSIVPAIQEMSLTEQIIHDIWVHLLPNPPRPYISPDLNFFDLGGDSILATRLILELRKSHFKNAPLNLILREPTISGMAKKLEKLNDAGSGCVENGSKAIAAATTSIDEGFSDHLARNRPFTAEYDYASEIPALIKRYLPTCIPFPESEKSYGKTYFLTGVTGFLGIFILETLLKLDPSSRVICLVRSKTREAAMERIIQAAQSHLVWEKEEFTARVEAVCGDLGSKKLGLSDTEWQHLSRDVDAIVHNGALVHWAYTYNQLYPANVEGTMWCLKLALTCRTKTFTFVSSTSMLDTEFYMQLSEEIIKRGGRGISEKDDLEGSRVGLKSGYGQTKWVAEKLIMEACARGMPAAIVRPGYVLGNSKTGVCNTDNFIWRLVKGCVELGAVPDIPEAVNMCPVDYVVKCIAKVAIRPAHEFKPDEVVFQVTHPAPSFTFNDLFDFLPLYGYEVEQHDYDKWRNILLEYTLRSKENALFPLLPVLLDESRSANKSPEIDNTNTYRLLQGENSPRMTVDLVGLYLAYMVRIGYMSKPSKSGLKCLPELPEIYTLM